MLQKRPSLADSVTTELLEMFRRGEFLPGELLPTQTELAARLGVSPATVRQAMQALTALGILDSQSGKGTWVAPHAEEVLVAPDMVRARLGDLDTFSVLEARSAIEVALTELAAEYATPTDVARIWDAQQLLESNIHDKDAFVDADLSFHLAVANASHNKLLIHFFGLARRLIAHVIAEVVEFPEARLTSVELQHSIAEAIEVHSRERARQAALAHMQFVRHLLERTINDSPKDV